MSPSMYVCFQACMYVSNIHTRFWARSQKCIKTAFSRLQKLYIRSKPKNGSRAIKMTRSGNGFGPGTRNALKRFSGGSKTRYSVQTEKWLARNENEPFWQWFWARAEKCLKTAFWRLQKLDIRSRPKKRLARNPG